MKFRLQFIKDFVNENCEEWKKLGYVNDKHINYQKLKTHLLDKSNYKDEYGRGDNTLDLRSKVNIDHIISKKGKKAFGNMDKVNNLVITKPKSNKIKSNRY
jgi:5-methylcytosine-specific restriction endonuclease McrA